MGPTAAVPSHCPAHVTDVLLMFAKIGENGLELDPRYFGPRTPAEATILTPDGEVTVRWVDAEHWEIV